MVLVIVPLLWYNRGERGEILCTGISFLTWTGR